MTSTWHEARVYDLHGERLHLVFHNGDADGMRLDYNGTSYTGRRLYREVSVLGLIVSVVVEGSPDHHGAFFTLVIPEAHRSEKARSVSVSTFAVFTTKRTSIAGTEGVSGQVDSYRVVPVTGNAW